MFRMSDGKQQTILTRTFYHLKRTLKNPNYFSKKEKSSVFSNSLSLNFAILQSSLNDYGNQTNDYGATNARTGRCSGREWCI